MISLAASSLLSTPLYVIRSAFTRSWLSPSALTRLVRLLGSLEPAGWQQHVWVTMAGEQREMMGERSQSEDVRKG